MQIDTALDRPPIYVTAAEYARLAPLARSTRTPGARLLSEELTRATILYGTPRPAAAHLGSVVTYLDRRLGQIRTVELVLPEDAHRDAGRISLLSPLGAGLLGLSEGDTFLWTEAGELLDLKVLGVGWRDQSLPEGGVRYFRRPPTYPSQS